MLLYDKFESRSSKAKAVVFHPTRPWLLAGLFSSTIQLWDHRMGCIIDRFEGHQGPVRSIDMHPTQQIFVSAGDDQIIRVWSLSERKLLFTLEGHQDYIRTVRFHKTLPWICSASDDQTVRIWDWQARKCIATLTGHNHWVSCAVFHPFEDLVVSSSLDCTVRAWDITGLKRRYSAAGVLPSSLAANASGLAGTSSGMRSDAGLPPWMGSANQNFQPGFPPGSAAGFDDPFGHEVVTKFILEGHDRGVTCVACHPTLPLLVSASDDRTLKVWRMSESRAWEIDTCRGHRDEATGCVFSPPSDAIVSCATDGTVRVWGLNKRVPMGSFPFISKDFALDRLWALATHPHEDLIALARDSGLLVFKLKPEKPAFVTQPVLAVASAADSTLRDEQNRGLASMQRLGLNERPARLKRVHFNAAENVFLAFHWREQSENGDYAFVSLYPNTSASTNTSANTNTSASTNTSANANALRIREIANATDAMFVSRNRIAVLANQHRLQIYDLELELTKELRLDTGAQFLFEGPQPGQIYLAGPTTLVLFDWQRSQVLASRKTKQIKLAALSTTKQLLAIASSHDLAILTPDLQELVKIEETIKLKSLVWDARLPVLLYTTTSHLKYALSNGDCGILQSLAHVAYLVAADGARAVLATRQGTFTNLKIDPTEYRFKHAVHTQNFAEVARLIEQSQLVGQSIIAYLQQSGYPEIALEFVTDQKTRFDLAIEFGNLSVAAPAAQQLQDPVLDERLAAAALEQGNHDLLEDVLQRRRSFDMLAFLYLATGNRSRLQRLEQLATQRGDRAAQFQTSLLLNSPATRVELLQQAGLAPLAYALAKRNGLVDEAEQILANNNVSEEDVVLSDNGGETAPVPVVKHETYKHVWPVKPAKTIDIAALAQTYGSATTPAAPAAGLAHSAANADNAAPVNGLEETAGDEMDAWDLDDGMDEDLEMLDSQPQSSATAGGAATTLTKPTERERWVQTSTVPADHIAAGSFESAAQLLNRQVGVVRFEPLKQRFFDVYEASKLSMVGHELLSPLEYTILRSSPSLPFVPGLEHLPSRLAEAFGQVKANQLELAIESFRNVLHTAVTLAVDTEAEELEVRKAIETSKNYILAFTIEVKRRALPKTDVKRNLELAAYFTKPPLRKAHAGLPLRTACMQASAAKNYSLASYFAGEYLKIDPTGPGGQKLAALKSKWDATKSLDQVDIDFDTFNSFEIDPHTLTPIYEGQPTVVEPLTRAKYHASHRGTLCAITQFTEVGASAPGLHLRA